MTDEKLEMLLGLLRSGYNILPANADTKRPQPDRTGQWKKYQTEHVTEEDVRMWHEQVPGRPWGCVCGAISGNLAVIDFDVPAIYEESFRSRWEDKTRAVRTTSGGYHLHFFTEDAAQTCAEGTEWKSIYGVDIRGEGGWIMLPPELEYSFINTREPLHIKSVDEVLDAWGMIDLTDIDFKAIHSAVTVYDMARHYGLQVKTGNEFTLVQCPFHNDHDPSLSIMEHKFKCHGCGAKGDVTTFVRLMENLENNTEAAKKIEEITGQQFRCP